ncbi:hypothetical protein ABFA07_013196 [Porites harrisoni]
MDKKTAPEKVEKSQSSLLNRFFQFMTLPTDPSNLAVIRILFGLLMILDIPQERSLLFIHKHFGDDTCHFPLFNFIQPLPVDWMHVVYLIMFLGACGIFLGFMFRLSCFSFMITYWYIFLLEKCRWNNHSYLYGLISFMLLLSDANRYWSLDGLFNPEIKNAHVPKWNYVLLRFQIFLVYFYAGIKKIDMDWMTGYSMTGLSREWVFDPFRLFLSDETIDLFLVHIGGLAFDLSEGFLLAFDKTRPIGIFFGAMFHGMNSQMFEIGMFPYAMMATLPLFCACNWPKKVLSFLPTFMARILPSLDDPQTSTHCVYPVSTVSEDKQQLDREKTAEKNQTPGTKHKALVLIVLTYIGIQLFLPYSHFITKGYNSWTQGLYGYSWDMMVHSWSTQHVRVKVVDQVSGEVTFIRPTAWLREGRMRRWNSHPDMIKQYVNCMAEKLKAFKELNITEPAIYLDVWRSMNKRFQQRMVDPTVDIVKAPWSPWKHTPWMLPLLTELSPWREKLAQIKKELKEKSNFSEITFVSDFPGLFLENFVAEDLNTSLTLLHGQVKVEFNNTNHTVNVGEEITVPSNDTHLVYTVSDTPSCWMYIYMNTTEWNNETIRNWILYPETIPQRQEYKLLKENTTRLELLKAFVANKYFIFRQSFVNTYYALTHLTLGIEEPMEDEEDDSTAAETGDEADKKTDDGNTLSSADDTGHVADEPRDKATGQESDHHRQEL